MILDRDTASATFEIRCEICAHARMLRRSVVNEAQHQRQADDNASDGQHIESRPPAETLHDRYEHEWRGQDGEK